MRSLSKGKRGELEFSKFLNKKLGTDYKRTPNSGGLDLKGDILCVGNKMSRARDYHFEIKRQEKLNIYKALEQATIDARDGKIPLVAFRRNNDKWKVCLYADDFLNILIELDDLVKQ